MQKERRMLFASLITLNNPYEYGKMPNFSTRRKL